MIDLHERREVALILHLFLPRLPALSQSSLLPHLFLHMSRLPPVISFAIPTNQPVASPNSHSFGASLHVSFLLAAIFVTVPHQ